MPPVYARSYSASYTASSGRDRRCGSTPPSASASPSFSQFHLRGAGRADSVGYLLCPPPLPLPLPLPLTLSLPLHACAHLHISGWPL
jgi:hypothetical protein